MAEVAADEGRQGGEDESNVSFKTRARTIDHLGRGQIADAPTAVSELWKNAWDAYATNVSLNIFDGTPVVAAVFDDGVGMSAAGLRGSLVGDRHRVQGRRPAAAAAAGFRRPGPPQAR